MKKEDRFTIFMSPGEVFWIAGHLGFKNIPFLSGVFRGQSPEAVRKAVQQGFEALLNRNMVHRQGARSVEVDSTLGSLVDMVANPEFINMITSIRKDETPIQTYLYFKNSQVVSVVFKDRFFHFTLFREEQALQRSLISWMGISGQISERIGSIRLPTGDIADLLQKIWASPEKVLETLQASGYSLEDAARLAEQYGQFGLYSTLNRIAPQEGRLVKQSQVIMLGNPANLWVLEDGEGSTEPPLMQPLTASQAVLVVTRYLRPDYTVEHSDNDLIL